MDKDRLDRQIEFIREIDKEKSIGRQTYLADASRKEDDAEHAWHMAIMTVLLSEYANEKIDVLRTMTMLLIHDLVEIDAGDTYAYDENAKKLTEYSVFFQKTRGNICVNCGRNSRHRKHQKQSLQELWITSSL